MGVKSHSISCMTRSNACNKFEFTLSQNILVKAVSYNVFNWRKRKLISLNNFFVCINNVCGVWLSLFVKSFFMHRFFGTWCIWYVSLSKAVFVFVIQIPFNSQFTFCWCLYERDLQANWVKKVRDTRTLLLSSSLLLNNILLGLILGLYLSFIHTVYYFYCKRLLYSAGFIWTDHKIYLSLKLTLESDHISKFWNPGYK